MTLFNNRGFTLIETLAAVMLISIVFMGVIEGANQFFSTSVAAIQLGSQDKVRRKFGLDFISAIESADISLHFQHLPITAGGTCVTGQPCVQSLSSSNVLQPYALAGASTVEFFRDAQGTLAPGTAFGNNVQGDVNASQVIQNLPLSIGANLTSTPVYVTWPLVDENSGAFVLLKSTSLGVSFTFPDTFATPSPPDSAGNWAIFSASAAGIAPSSLAGNLLVIYNAYSDNQFFFQTITNAMDCSQPPAPAASQCTTIASSLNSTFNTGCLNSAVGSKACPTGSVGTNGQTQNYYALNLQTVDSTAFSAFLPAGVPSAGTWGSQSADFFIFPTAFFSVTNANEPDLTASADIRKIVHFYHSNALQESFFAIPVEARAYSMRTIKTNGPTPHRQLILSDFYQSESRRGARQYRNEDIDRLQPTPGNEPNRLFRPIEKGSMYAEH